MSQILDNWHEREEQEKNDALFKEVEEILLRDLMPNGQYKPLDKPIGRIIFSGATEIEKEDVLFLINDLYNSVDQAYKKIEFLNTLFHNKNLRYGSCLESSCNSIKRKLDDIRKERKDLEYWMKTDEKGYLRKKENY